jgi:hypothetical protein
MTREERRRLTLGLLGFTGPIERHRAVLSKHVGDQRRLPRLTGASDEHFLQSKHRGPCNELT